MASKKKFFEGLKPGNHVVEAVKAANQKRAAILDLSERLEQQRETVNELAKTVEDMVRHKPWKKCLTPEDALASRQKLEDAREQYAEEESMLDAVQVALENTQRESQQALNVVESTVRDTFRDAALAKEGAALSALESAMDDYLAVKLAISHKTGRLDGAIYELEMKVKDNFRHANLGRQYGQAIKDFHKEAQTLAS